MAQVILTIPDAQLNRVITAICNNFAYQANIPILGGGTIPNPETPGQYAKRMWIENTMLWIEQAEGLSAKQTAIANVISQITIT